MRLIYSNQILQVTF